MTGTHAFFDILSFTGTPNWEVKMTRHTGMAKIHKRSRWIRSITEPKMFSATAAAWPISFYLDNRYQNTRTNHLVLYITHDRLDTQYTRDNRVPVIFIGPVTDDYKRHFRVAILIHQSATRKFVGWPTVIRKYMDFEIQESKHSNSFFLIRCLRDSFRQSWSTCRIPFVFHTLSRRTRGYKPIGLILLLCRPSIHSQSFSIHSASDANVFLSSLARGPSPVMSP